MAEYLPSGSRPEKSAEKQNHVHVLNAKGERVPLAHCQRAENPKLCKGDFPRTRWVKVVAEVLCQGRLRQMGMSDSGRRSKLGALLGPVNDEYLN